jgi:cell filamentation protein
MSDASDPYLYPGTDVLKNVPDLRDAEQLRAFETVNTTARIYEILLHPIAGTFGQTHLKAIHRHIFQDVFTWAGQFRTTMLGKAESIGQPTTWFTPPHLLEHEAERIFGWLRLQRQTRWARRRSVYDAIRRQ